MLCYLYKQENDINNIQFFRPENIIAEQAQNSILIPDQRFKLPFFYTSNHRKNVSNERENK
jgi:hypothetical protein